MTEINSYLTDYQEIDGGFVAFRGVLKSKINYAEGKNRTSKLDFEDVYFVKELKFNLFSVSQMCDKKNSVLFTETEYLVLSPDFKLHDESLVLFKVPRHDNMYSFDLKNVVHSGGLTYLFAKATIDESNLWHRRLGHINFKTMNKLVRGNLVRGLPSKLFENNHTCVACQKGKNQTNRNQRDLDNVISTYSNNIFLATLLYDSHRELRRDCSSLMMLVNRLMKTSNEGDKNVKRRKRDTSNKEGNQNVQDLRVELYNLLIQQKQGYANSTNRVSTVSLSVGAARKSFINVDDLLTDPLMPDLEDTADLLNIGIFSIAYNDEDMGAEAVINNLETTINVSHILTTRIHKDHLKDQIIGDINSATQTRRMTKFFEEHVMIEASRSHRIGVRQLRLRTRAFGACDSRLIAIMTTVAACTFYGGLMLVCTRAIARRISEMSVDMSSVSGSISEVGQLIFIVFLDVLRATEEWYHGTSRFVKGGDLGE
ncbi:ribonuclease H-like domain-containing protein [Tanacetum coccineum]